MPLSAALSDYQNLDLLLERLCKQQTDDEFIEVKSCAHKLSESIWESVSAFANTRGGWLILGIDENQGFRPIKGFPTNKVLSQFISGMGESGSGKKITNPPLYEIHRVEYQEEIILVVQIFELPLKNRPCYITAYGNLRGSYKRVDDRDILLSPAELYEIENVYVTSRADLEPVSSATENDLSFALCEAIINKARTITPRAIMMASSREEQLANLNILNARGEITLAGLLCAGKYPQRFFPKLYIDVAVHPGNEKSAPGSLRFLDRTICEGTLVEMLNDAVVAIAKNLRRTSVVKGLERFDELEIPESVFREALANALVHREYNFNFQGQAIAVDVFPNRIEITSPGMLWGGKSIDNLDNGESCCRNAALMKLLMFAPLSEQGGFTVEGNGSGIIHMIRTMKSMNLPAPEFEANFSSVKVTLWRGASQQSDDEPRGVAASKTAEGNSANSAQSRLEKESMEILNLIKEKGEVGMSDLKVWGGYTDSKARTRVNHLLEEGLIEPTAEKTSRNRKYRIKRSA